MKEIKNKDKSRKKSAVLFACIFVVLGMWMMLSVHCQAAETNNDEKQPQTIRVGSFEDTFNYVDKNGVRRGYGYEHTYTFPIHRFEIRRPNIRIR